MAVSKRIIPTHNQEMKMNAMWSEVQWKLFISTKMFLGSWGLILEEEFIIYKS